MDALSSALQGFFEPLDSMGAMNIFGSLGLAAFVLGAAQWIIDRRRWRHFKAAVYEWVDLLYEAGNRHPNELLESEWQAACEQMLVDARFRPSEIVQLLDLAVIVARAIAANKIHS